jgi:RNA polymerase sigma-70 factor (ECF subfamily)
MNADDPASARWFADEVQVHATALRNWLRGKYPCLADPDNLVQESLTRVWRVAQEGTVRSPKALLYTTASHLALDEIRRRKIVPFESLRDDDHLTVIEDAPPAPDTVARREELELMTQAIQSLHPRCRQAITLLKLGYSHKAIAEDLGISVRAVEAHLVKGMRGCVKFLARHGLP